MKKEDVRMTVEDNAVCVSGRRKNEQKGQKKKIW